MLVIVILHSDQLWAHAVAPTVKKKSKRSPQNALLQQIVNILS